MSAGGGSSNKRAIVYDLTHLTTRLTGAKTTGIDWVDRAYARHFAHSEREIYGLHYGLFAPHLHSQSRLAALSLHHEKKFLEADTGGAEDAWRQLRRWLVGAAGEQTPASSNPRARESLSERLASFSLKTRMRVANDALVKIPQDAVYLNVAQHGFEYPRLFEWLDSRPDVLPVFLVHDLLPLDAPDYFREGYEGLFRRRFDLVQRRARGVLATCGVTGDRIRAAFERSQIGSPQIHAQPLASPLGPQDEEDLRDPDLATQPYFVTIGTLEPRKNHALLLDVWRALATENDAPPKLVLVGEKGRLGDQILDSLARSKLLAPHVRQVSGLTSPALRRLLSNACALLAPNHAEGYGIPLVDALAVGAPVICSDIPVFREVTQNCATFVSPLDGIGWKTAIRRFAEKDSPEREEARRIAQKFAAPAWLDYFSGVENFLDCL